MPRQFTPEDKDTVRKDLKKMAKGGEVGETINGLYFVKNHRPSMSFGRLVKGHGWAVSALHYVDTDENDNEVLVEIEPIEIDHE